MSWIYDYDLQKIAKKCAAETGGFKRGERILVTWPAYDSFTGGGQWLLYLEPTCRKAT